MRRVLNTSLLLTALVLMTSSALGADAEIFWAESWKAAVAEAKERGAKIVVVLTMDGEAANDAQKEVWRNDKSVAKAAGAFVCLFANRGKEHGEEKVRVGGKQVLRCRIAKKFLTDIEGKVLEVFAVGSREAGFDLVTGPDLAGQLEAAAKKHGAGLDRGTIEKFKRAMASGGDLLAKKKYADAAARYAEVAKGAPKGMSLRADAEKKLAEIAAIGQAGIEEGRALAALKKYGEAIARLELVKTEFAKTAAATEADKEIDAINSNPAVKKLMSDRAALAASAKLLASAQSAEKKRKWARALAKYDECAAKYGALPAGSAAKKRAAELRADEKVAAAILEASAAKDCRRWLSMAKNLINNGMNDKAKRELQKVLDKYPGTSYAEKAKQMLSKL